MRISATVFIIGLAVFVLFSLLDRPREGKGLAPLRIAVPGLLGVAAVLGGSASWLICNIWGIA